MKNYQKVLMSVAIGLIANDLFPQGAYFNVNAGYAWRMGAQSDIANYESQYFGSGNSTSTYKVHHVSFGKGLNFGGTFGYMFNENIGAEIGVSYLLGGKITSKYSYADIDGTSTEEYTMYSRMLRFNPSIVFSLGGKKIKPYAKLGMIMGKGKINTDASNNIRGGIFGPETETMKMEYYGGFAFGCSSAFGAIYGLNDKLSLFGELNIITLSYAPTKGKVTEYTVNGVDKITELKTSEKEIDFLDSYTETSSNNPPVDTEPSKDLKTKMPFGSIGLNVGLRVSF